MFVHVGQIALLWSALLRQGLSLTCSTSTTFTHSDLLGLPCTHHILLVLVAQVDEVLRRHELTLRRIFEAMCALKPKTMENGGFANKLATYKIPSLLPPTYQSHRHQHHLCSRPHPIARPPCPHPTHPPFYLLPTSYSARLSRRHHAVMPIGAR